MGDEFD